MATLAEINETLINQTDVIEDGTRTTAGLRDRFGEFLDRQKGGGDKREDELEAKQKERNQRVIAQRPSNFTQGLKQGLGLPGGFGIDGIAQKILGAMGFAAGAIGLGAGKLLRLGPAIAVMSKFGEQAIGGFIDYVDGELDSIDFSETAKEDLTKGGQFALASRFLGFRNPLSNVLAGAVGAYGDELMDIVNKRLKNEDGTYTIPFLEKEVNTKSEEFQMALAAAVAAFAPTILSMSGGIIKTVLKKIPLTRAVQLVGLAAATFFGLRSGSGVPPDADEIEKNKKKDPGKKPPKIKPSILGSTTTAKFLTANAPLGNAKINAGNLSAFAGRAAADPRVNMKPANLNSAPKPKPKLMQSLFNSVNDKMMANIKHSTDTLSKSVGKMLVVPAILYEYLSGIGSDELSNVPPVLQGVTNLTVEATAGTIDAIDNIAGSILNMGIMGTNFAANQAGMGENLIGFRFQPSDYAGAIKRGINQAFLDMPKLNDQGMIDIPALFPPDFGLQPGAGAGFESAPTVGSLDQSRNSINDNSMKILSVGNTTDFGSRVVGNSDF